MSECKAGEGVYLGDILVIALTWHTWLLGSNTKSALPIHDILKCS